ERVRPRGRMTGRRREFGRAARGPTNAVPARHSPPACGFACEADACGEPLVNISSGNYLPHKPQEAA
ncbi:hypothetical protein, partial [Caenimonas sedimenti]|uniref:hypothetical protein n=1 Tax=Caenimonas sedimenti TaxID=2596921 RepID=UPI001C977644